MKKNLLFTSMLICMLFVSQGLRAGGSDGYFYYYYAKVTAKTASESSAKGCVYVSTTAASVESATAETSNATGQDPNNYGETTDAPTEAGQVKFYLYAKPASGYKFDGWSTSATRPSVFESTKPVWETTFGASTAKGSASTTNPGGTQNSGSTASSDKTQYYCTSTAEHSIYAYFSEMVSEFAVSLAQPTNGSIKVGGVDPSSWPYKVSTTTGELTTTLTATPNSGYSFWGWYTLNNDGSKNYLSYDATYNATFNDATTVYAEFYSSSLALFQTAGVNFYDLNLANAKAVANGGGTIVVTKNGTVPAGNYTIASGVTLLVPLNADYQVHTTPSTVTSGTPSRSVYRTLTLDNGTNITLNGSICVDAIMCLTMGYNGSAMNGYGLIDMKAGSTITMKSGSNLYVWGFVIGDGSIVAESGATIHETFQFKHRGGNALKSIAQTNATKKVFPINQYYIQSIEAPITFRKGATEKVYTGVHNADDAISINFIGSSGLFNMTGTNSYLIKKYDVSKDRQNYTLYGDATIGSIVFGMYGFNKDSRDFVLPITNNMTLNVESGTTTIQYETAILPDVEVNIASAAKISTSNNCYVYDSLNWKGAYAYANDYSAAEKAQVAPVVYRHGGLKYNRKNYKLRDAAINVNGTLEGKIYTTEGGANIKSSLGTGVVKFTAALSSTTTNQAGQDGTTGKFDAYTVYPAQLHNASQWYSAPYTGDGKACEYLATAGTAANTTINYKNGHWGWVEIWKDYDGTVLKAINTVAKSTSGTAPSDPTRDGFTFNGWGTASVDDAKQEVTHTAQYIGSYVITYTSPSNGTYTIKVGDATPVSVNTTAESGKTITLAATPAMGYKLSAWSVKKTNGGAAVTVTNNTFTMPAEAVTVSATFDYDIANYTVKHWQQNVENDEYTEFESETKQGTTATATAAEAKPYTGFTAQSFSQGTIAGDGSTVVNIYYDRNTYTITWKDGSEIIKTEPWKYGATPAFAYEKPETAQYTYELIGWSNGANIYDFPAALPVVTANATYTARYKSHTRSYLITFVNDDNETVLLQGTVNYGVKPEYTGTPTSTKTDGIYQFTGWSDEIVAVAGPATYTAQYAKLMDLVVEEGETLNVETTMGVTSTTIHVAGKVNVTEGKTLTTDNLILEATPTSSGEITGAGTVSVTTNAYFHFSQEGGFKARTWYAVAVPWQVNVPAYNQSDCGVYIKTKDGEFVQQELGKTFDLIYYDGYRRSQGATKAWNYVEDDDDDKQIMYPGRAYMIYLTADADIIRFKKNSETLLYTNVPVARYASDNGNLADWNGIANPAIYKAYLNVGATKDKGQIYNPDTKQYEWFDMKNNQLQVGQPIFVQSTVSGTILANANEYASSSLAPRRAKESVKPITDYELMLAASDADVSDRIIVSTDEDKEADEYIVGQDLAKMGVSSVVAQMWIDRYDSKMCINTVAPINNTADYPLGIFAPKDGEYDLFIDDQPNDETMLYLTYDGEAIWNLSYGGYVATLTKGTNTHYGLRIVYAERRTPTGIEEATIQNGESIRKVLVDDKVFIIRGNNVYSIDGQLVK